MDPHNILEQLGHLFYVVNPNRTSFETTAEVPNYLLQVTPHFVLLIILEQCVLLYKNKPMLRINDGIGSIAQGLLMSLTRLVALSIQIVSYTYVYNNWRIATLPWDSLWTWLLCFLAVDFCYYWLHRMSHEVNILWAAHQVHHSSEDYNLTTALRQSVFQNYSVWIFNLPMALAIPPSVFLVHSELNLLYQFWIHTEAITNLGPLEYVLNTASHHRVHHGRNRYCIDKNYAGVLIIWDRLFGTFQPEAEEVVYGLTHPINSFESFQIQLCHYIHIWRTLFATEGLSNKLSVLFKGPGWSPGKPRLGNLEDIPDVKAPMEKFDPQLPLWCKLYALLHFSLLVAAYVEMAENIQTLPTNAVWATVAYEIFSISVIGMLLEGRPGAPWFEILRCSSYIMVDWYLLPYTRLYKLGPTLHWWIAFILRAVHLSSFMVWLQQLFRTPNVHLQHSASKKEQ